MSQTRRLAAILAADVAGFPAKIANSRAYGRSAPVDSLVERNGFELPVPRENGYRSESSGFVYLPETVRVSSKNPKTSGTEVSNPLRSSSESSELRSRDRRPERRDLGFGADRGHVARWPARRRLLDWAIRAG